MPTYVSKWQKIKEVLADAPTPNETLAMLESAELSLDEFYSTYSDEKISDAVRYAKDLKDRYTVLWLYESISK